MGNFNLGDLKRNQILKGFQDDIEKARHGVYADNAQNRRLQRVGQEYGKAAQKKEETGEQSSASEEGVSLQNHARSASEEALKKVANDPTADSQMRKVATQELERRGINIRSKNKAGTSSLRDNSVDSDAKENSKFESLGFRKLDNVDLQTYSGVENPDHAYIMFFFKQKTAYEIIAVSEDGKWRVDKYPYNEVDNFESSLVDAIEDVDKVISKYDKSAKKEEDSAAKYVKSFDDYTAGDSDSFDSKGFKAFIKTKGVDSAIKELADYMRNNPVDSDGEQSDITDDEIADTIEEMFDEANINITKKVERALDKMRGSEEADTKKTAVRNNSSDSNGKQSDATDNEAEKFVKNFDDYTAGDVDSFDAKGFKNFVKTKGVDVAIKELANYMREHPADEDDDSQSDVTDDEIADTIEEMFDEAGINITKKAEKALDKLREGEEEEEVKEEKPKKKKLSKKEREFRESMAKHYRDRVQKELDFVMKDAGIPKEQADEMFDFFVSSPYEDEDFNLKRAEALVNNTNTIAKIIKDYAYNEEKNKKFGEDLYKMNNAKSDIIKVLLDPNVRQKGIGENILSHPEIKPIIDDFLDAEISYKKHWEEYKKLPPEKRDDSIFYDDYKKKSESWDKFNEAFLKVYGK